MKALQTAPCARCAMLQKTCCQQAEIVVTGGDVERIERHTGRAQGSFVEWRRPADPSYLQVDPLDPDWKRYTVRDDGTRHMLQRRSNGDCVFLGASGCVLPLTSRPLVCRLYPFAYTERGITGVETGYCPTAHLSADGRSMVEVLGMDPELAEEWRHQLYVELADGLA